METIDLTTGHPLTYDSYMVSMMTHADHIKTSQARVNRSEGIKQPPYKNEEGFKTRTGNNIQRTLE